MLPLVRYVSHAFVACYQIDCWVFLNYYLFTFAYAGSLWLCTSALLGRVGASLQLRCCSFCWLVVEPWPQELRRAGSAVAARGLRSCAHGLSCSAARGIFLD